LRSCWLVPVLQIFILDEKTYPTENILDPALKEGQGPALIAYNDGVLLPDDWTALLTIHSSSKQGDEESVFISLCC
jgi:sacsin